MKRFLILVVLLTIVLPVFTGGACFAASRKQNNDLMREVARREKELRRLEQKQLRQQKKELKRTERELREELGAEKRTKPKSAGANLFRNTHLPTVQEERERRAIIEQQTLLELAALHRKREERRAASEKSKGPPVSYAAEARRLKWRNEGKAGLMAQWGHELCLKTLDWSEMISNKVCPSWGEGVRQFIGSLLLLFALLIAKVFTIDLLVIGYYFPGYKIVLALSGLVGAAAVISSEIILSPSQTSIMHIISVGIVAVSTIIAIANAVRNIDTARRSVVLAVLLHALFAVGAVFAGAVIVATALQVFIVGIVILIAAILGPRFSAARRDEAAEAEAARQLAKEDEFRRSMALKEEADLNAQRAYIDQKNALAEAQRLEQEQREQEPVWNYYRDSDGLEYRKNQNFPHQVECISSGHCADYDPIAGEPNRFRKRYTGDHEVTLED